MPDTYNILHLTDLHYTNRTARNREQSTLLKALLDDIEHITLIGLKPDVIVFNGDLANEADEEDVYYDVYENFLEPLLQKTRLTGDRLVLVPGNHDVMRSAVRSQSAVHREFYERFGTKEINDYFSGVDAAELQRAKLRNFLDTYELCGCPVFDAAPGYQLIKLPALDTTFCLLNTAYSSAGGLPEVCTEDYGKLFIPEYLLSDMCDAIESSGSRFKFLVGHHPSEWFKEESRRLFDHLITRTFDGYFAGHVHVTDPQFISSTAGSCTRFQTGALHQGKDRWNGYSIVRVSKETKHFEILARRCAYDQRKFVSANEIGEDGRFYTSAAAKSHWRNWPAIDRTKLSEWVLNTLSEKFEEKHGLTLIGKSIDDVFLETPMQTRMQDFEKSEYSIDVDNSISFQAISDSSENFVVFGDTNFGKSTLLKRLGLELIEKSNNPELLSIPALLDFTDIETSGTGMMKAIAKCTAGLNDSVSLKQLLSEGLITILVDDVDPREEKRVEALLEFTETYPRCRYILTTRPMELGLGMGLVAKFDRAVSFREVTLLPLKSKGIRTFAALYCGDDEPEKCERLVKKIISTLKQAALPPTAFAVSVLLEVFEGLKGDVLINEVTLIERFVEYLLMKEQTSEAARASFNFTDKTRCLAYLAMHMAKNDSYDMPYDEVLAVVKEFIDQIGFPHNPKEILQGFIEQKILRRTEIGHYRFYLRAFLEYFVAQRMAHDEDFRKWVMNEGRYLSFVHEIEFFCGMNPDDTGILEIVASRHEALWHSLWDINGVSLDEFEKIELPSDRQGALEELHEQLASPRLSKEERDELIDADLEMHDTKQAAYRPKAETLDSRLFLSLALYSTVLRNLEHLPKEQKELHFSAVLRCWIEHLWYSYSIVPSIVEHRMLRVRGIEYRTFSHSVMSDEKLTRMLMLYLPTGLSSLMRSYLGSEKMVRQVEFKTDNADALITKLMRAFLLSDLDVSDWIATMSGLRQELVGKQYLNGALIWKLNMILKMREPNREKSERIIDILARTYAEQSGKDAKDVQRIYTQKHRELQQSLQVRVLKEKADKRAARISMKAEPRGVGDVCP